MTGLTHRAHAHHAVAFGHGVAACDCVLIADALTSGAAGAAHVPVRKGNGRAGRMFFFFPTFFFQTHALVFAHMHARSYRVHSGFSSKGLTPPRLASKRKRKRNLGDFFFGTHTQAARVQLQPLSPVCFSYTVYILYLPEPEQNQFSTPYPTGVNVVQKRKGLKNQLAADQTPQERSVYACAVAAAARPFRWFGFEHRLIATYDGSPPFLTFCRPQAAAFLGIGSQITENTRFHLSQKRLRLGLRRAVTHCPPLDQRRNRIRCAPDPSQTGAA